MQKLKIKIQMYVCIPNALHANFYASCNNDFDYFCECIRHINVTLHLDNLFYLYLVKHETY